MVKHVNSVVTYRGCLDPLHMGAVISHDFTYMRSVCVGCGGMRGGVVRQSSPLNARSRIEGRSGSSCESATDCTRWAASPFICRVSNASWCAYGGTGT